MTAAERARAVLAIYDAQEPETIGISGTNKDGSPVERYSLIETAAEMAAILRELVAPDPQGDIKVGDLDPEPDWEGDFCATDRNCSLHIGHTGRHLCIEINPETGQGRVVTVWP